MADDVHMTFNIATGKTMRCDFCNARNTSSLNECNDCRLHICHPCARQGLLDSDPRHRLVLDAATDAASNAGANTSGAGNGNTRKSGPVPIKPKPHVQPGPLVVSGGQAPSAGSNGRTSAPREYDSYSIAIQYSVPGGSFGRGYDDGGNVVPNYHHHDTNYQYGHGVGGGYSAGQGYGNYPPPQYGTYTQGGVPDEQHFGYANGAAPDYRGMPPQGSGQGPAQAAAQGSARGIDQPGSGQRSQTHSLYFEGISGFTIDPAADVRYGFPPPQRFSRHDYSQPGYTENGFPQQGFAQQSSSPPQQGYYPRQVYPQSAVSLRHFYDPQHRNASDAFQEPSQRAPRRAEAAPGHEARTLPKPVRSLSDAYEQYRPTATEGKYFPTLPTSASKPGQAMRAGDSRVVSQRNPGGSDGQQSAQGPPRDEQQAAPDTTTNSQQHQQVPMGPPPKPRTDRTDQANSTFRPRTAQEAASLEAWKSLSHQPGYSPDSTPRAEKPQLIFEYYAPRHGSVLEMPDLKVHGRDASVTSQETTSAAGAEAGDEDGAEAGAPRTPGRRVSRARTTASAEKRPDAPRKGRKRVVRKGAARQRAGKKNGGAAAATAATSATTTSATITTTAPAAPQGILPSVEEVDHQQADTTASATNQLESQERDTIDPAAAALVALMQAPAASASASAAAAAPGPPATTQSYLTGNQIVLSPGTLNCFVTDERRQRRPRKKVPDSAPRVPASAAAPASVVGSQEVGGEEDDEDDVREALANNPILGRVRRQEGERAAREMVGGASTLVGFSLREVRSGVRDDGVVEVEGERKGEDMGGLGMKLRKRQKKE